MAKLADVRGGSHVEYRFSTRDGCGFLSISTAWMLRAVTSFMVVMLAAYALIFRNLFALFLLAAFLSVFIAVFVDRHWELDRTQNRARRWLSFFGWRFNRHDFALAPGEQFVVRPRRLFGVLAPDSGITELVLPENTAHRSFLLLSSANTAEQSELATKLNSYLSMAQRSGSSAT